MLGDGGDDEPFTTFRSRSPSPERSPRGRSRSRDRGGGRDVRAFRRSRSRRAEAAAGDLFGRSPVEVRQRCPSGDGGRIDRRDGGRRRVGHRVGRPARGVGGRPAHRGGRGRGRGRGCGCGCATAGGRGTSTATDAASASANATASDETPSRPFHPLCPSTATDRGGSSPGSGSCCETW